MHIVSLDDRFSHSFLIKWEITNGDQANGPYTGSQNIPIGNIDFLRISMGNGFVIIDGSQYKTNGKQHHDRPYILPVLPSSVVNAIDEQQVPNDHTGIDEVKGYPAPFVIVYLDI